MSANLCDIGRLYCVAGVRKNLVSVTFCGVCAPCCLFLRKPARQVKILGVVKTIKPIGACLWLPCVPQDIFFLPISNFEHGLFHVRYFDNGPLEPG